MKKICVLAAAFALAGFTAQAQEATTPQTQQAEQQGKQKVNPDELPDAVMLAIADSDYKEWTLGEVYKLQPAEEGAPVVYEVQFLNGEEEPVVVLYSEAGTKVEN